MNQLCKVVVPDSLREDTEAQILAAAPDASVAEVMRKDLHLVASALATDRRIISMDNVARGHFARAAGKVPDLRAICWVNPEQDTDFVLDWLGAGAPVRKRWLLPAFLE